MPESASLGDLLRVLIPTLIGAAIGLVGPILYARYSRKRRKRAQEAESGRGR